MHRWAAVLKENVDAPDLWEVILAGKALPAATTQDDEPFTPDEQEKVAAGLAEIETYLLTVVQLQKEQQEYVRRQFEYLEARVSRLGKRDWLKTTLGTLWQIMLAASLTGSEARDLLRFAGQQLSSAVGFAVDAATDLLN